MNFVLDTSVTMRWFFGDGSPKDREFANKVLDELETATAVVPVTWGLEVANVLARTEAKGIMPEHRSDEFLKRLNSANIELDNATFEFAFSDTLDLARAYKLSTYDASYLELALRLGIPLATLDEVLQKAAKKAGVKKFT